jgi:hypothetical protein
MGSFHDKSECDDLLCTSYIKDHYESWFAADRKLLRKYPTANKPRKWCWIDDKRTELNVGDKQLTFDVFRKSSGTQPETIFYYWNGNPIDLPFDVAVDFFTARIDLTGNFTAIFTKGKLLQQYDVKSENETTSKVSIWHQRYEPTEPLVKARNLVCIYVVNLMTINNVKCAIISMRSMPPECVPHYIDLDSGEPLILLRAGYMLVENGNTTSVHKFDSEDEGGLLFQPLTNLVYPKYLIEESTKATIYVKEHKNEIIENYNARH